MIKTGIGQDSHPFDIEADKLLILGGVSINYLYGLKGNSDADVVLHAITNAISSITSKPILGKITDELCQQGVKNSNAYLILAHQDLLDIGYCINHIAISIEAKSPKLTPYFDAMRNKIAANLNLTINQIGITATTGEGLTSVGQAKGIAVIALITASLINYD